MPEGAEGVSSVPGPGVSGSGRKVSGSRGPTVSQIRLLVVGSLWPGSPRRQAGGFRPDEEGEHFS